MEGSRVLATKSLQNVECGGMWAVMALPLFNILRSSILPLQCTEARIYVGVILHSEVHFKIADVLSDGSILKWTDLTFKSRSRGKPTSVCSLLYF